MIASELNTLVAGLLFSFAGASGLVRHFLLEPTIPPHALPRTPRWLLRVFFGFSTVMLYVGMRYLTVWGTGSAVTAPPGVTGLGVLIAFTICTYKTSLLADTIMRKPSFTLDDIVKGLKNL